MVQPASLPTATGPIKFGTDGWRGVIAADFTFERLAKVARAAAQVLNQTYGEATQSQTVVVGYDRRFLAEDFAKTAAEAVRSAGLQVLLADTYASTPALSWAVKQHQALGALVITASHNPAAYLGLKVKGAFGGSVPATLTQAIEALLQQDLKPAAVPGEIQPFNPWPGYCQVLGAKVKLERIQEAITQGQLTVIVDVMHGSAAGGLTQILGVPIPEINSDRDPLFEGGAPEPLPRYLKTLIQQIKAQPAQPGATTLGLVFDGDGDRIAAVDSRGNFLSPQVLVPILVDHLAARRGFSGEVIKTISGSDLIPKVAALHDLPVFETPIGYKYIADRMLDTESVLLGGEESGGIGYGNHIPERDALLSALYLLEAVAESGQDLTELYQDLQARTDYTSFYDRLDLPLASMAVRTQLLKQLQEQPPTEIAGAAVQNCLSVDGYKFRLANQSWLLIRFSGTEPVLRLYSEAATPEQVQENLTWAKQWATQE